MRSSLLIQAFPALLAATFARGQAPPSVPVAHPSFSTVSRMVEQPGQLEPFETTLIHARAAGYVSHVAVNIGDKIKAGQTLLEISAPELDADMARKKAQVQAAHAGVRQAESAVAVARAGLEAAKAHIAHAQAAVAEAEADVTRREAEFKRVEQLSREGVVTESLLDEIRSARDAVLAARDAANATVLSVTADVDSARVGIEQAQSNLVAAQAQVDVAQADLLHAESLAAYRRVLAPYDGVVVRRQVDTGHLTRISDQGPPLLIVARVDHITVVVDVPEAEAIRVEPGDLAQIRIQALDGKLIEAPVTRAAGGLDAASHTLRVEIDLPNTEGTLRPGLYAYVGIAIERHENVLTIPTTAVVRDGDKTACMVVRDGVAHRVPISLGLAEADRVEVKSGLHEADLVVVTTPGALANGQRVQPMPSLTHSKP